MNELQEKIWVEKYRPETFNDLIFGNKILILNHLKNPLSMPSFIFYSNHPGTGKTTTAKIIIRTLDCDALIINASDERGIDTIREKISTFARNMSSNPNTLRDPLGDFVTGTQIFLPDSGTLKAALGV